MSDDLTDRLAEAVESAGVLPTNGNDQQDRKLAHAIATTLLPVVQAYADERVAEVSAPIAALAERIHAFLEAARGGDRRG